MTNSTGTQSVRHAPGAESAKPLAPMWIFKAVNPLMRALLRSPLHPMLSGTLMLLTYQGRKSGKWYTNPVGYFDWAEDEVMSFTTGRWWTNLTDGSHVLLRIKGQQVEATPTVIRDHDAVIQTVEEFIKRLGLKKADMLPLGLPADRPPTAK